MSPTSRCLGAAHKFENSEDVHVERILKKVQGEGECDSSRVMFWQRKRIPGVEAGCVWPVSATRLQVARS